ncbi:hypothetical protein A2Z10_00730 [Candidatus Azambacteria bacterium RBG_16_47_10]|uniref:Uncharacterized protein n=1 Tax=Candidatus Azambacteria bacterium RBG_16_47_10 TaxID=1797292 RepID=A0A1F5B0M3_9BACT|nr:MAG: hypothetical protein A2Z10_00730 [Candidatus Azambacteria bacterium RBG_16_47_10]
MKINSKAILYSTVGVIWFVVVTAIGTEISASFKSLLVGLTGHHWTAKSILAVVVFIVLYILFRKSDESADILKGVYYVLGSVVLGGIMIFSFFLWHFING